MAWFGRGLLAALGAGLLLLGFNNCSEDPSSGGGPGYAVLGSEFSGAISGELTIVERSGLVMGYAFDPRNTDKKMRVHFVADGAESGGTYLGSTVAAETLQGVFTGRYFQFQIPPAFADGRTHTLYAYGYEVGRNNRLAGSPMSFVVLIPKAEGVYVSSGLSSTVSTTCNACHSWNHRDLYFAALADPLPSAGGSATNNILIRKMTGAEAHGGGTFCTPGSSTICSAIQVWWRAEFAP